MTTTKEGVVRPVARQLSRTLTAEELEIVAGAADQTIYSTTYPGSNVTSTDYDNWETKI